MELCASSKNISARTEAVDSERMGNNLLTGVSPIINQKNSSKVPQIVINRDEETADELGQIGRTSFNDTGTNLLRSKSSKKVHFDETSLTTRDNNP